MKPQIKAIETEYNGYKFRSRTEARWAVFFDAMGYKWEYEKEGYILSDGTKYLPDFYFPEINLFAEVKGAHFTTEEERKCRLLSENDNEIILLVGPPDETSYKMYKDGMEICNGIFIPKGCKYYPILYAYDFDGNLDETTKRIHEARAARFEKFNK